jgi:hypothetical protein
MVNHSSRVETAVQVRRAVRVYRVKRVLRDNGVLEEKQGSTQLRRVTTKAGQARTVSAPSSVPVLVSSYAGHRR